MRLDKFLSHIGYGSRKEVAVLIKRGKVKVNSQVIKDPSFKVNPEKDIIEVSEKRLELKSSLFYYKFYKPKGYVTSTKDPSSPTIMEIIPQDLPGYSKIFPAGRLDKDAEGLLILTNDGTLAHRIIHPKWKLPKVYEVKISPELKEGDKEVLEKGVELSDGKTLPCKLRILNEEKTELEITVYEGRYHLLKRMFGKLGYRVLHIKRIAVGPIKLEDLKEGEIRPFTEKEIEDLKKSLKL